MIKLPGRDEVNPHKPDYSATGRRPVQWQRETLFHQHFRLVTVLGVLRRDDINSDKPDNGGRAPHWWAASNGHEGAVS